jgi:UDP-N-acetylmuramoyl-L-alanyl-D-glutamate--2,6-diaminopimelate ligase
VEFEAFRKDFAVGDKWFLPLPGEYNVQNALAALCVVCERFGVSPLQAKELLAEATVSGRFETVTHPALPDVTFVIDYAHNGVSLASILDALKQYAPNRLICLFGSVGGRTRERRQDLAKAAAYRCGLCVLTADNPGAEPVMDILREIDGHFPADGCPRILEPDREEAIRRLVREAQTGDVILLAGKGHEDYQLIGPHRVPFSERQILLDALEEQAVAEIMG